jgi:hypothetical protein
MFSRWGKWIGALEHCILTIDVPLNNEEGPLAVENFFAQLAGGHGNITKWHRYYHGKLQSFFTFEIVSIGGNTQFLVHTERKFRDLIEASVYAQYPDAEITEVEDYVDNVPEVFPNDTHRLWGVEFTLSDNYCYPIKSYADFEHSLSQEFKDPMSAMMEVMGSIKPNEQIWYQLTVTPIDHNTWRGPCKDLLNEMSGKKVSNKKSGIFGFIGGLFNEPNNSVQEIIRQVTASGDVENSQPTKATIGEDGIPFKIYSPIDVDTMKSISKKISKIAFDVKMRLIYIAPHEDFQVSRVVNPFIGAVKQFTELNANSIKPTIRITATRASYMFVKTRIAYKTRRILRAYRARSNYRGLNPMKLNIEELATIWHFPTIFVKTSTVQSTASKKYDAPINVPYEQRKAETVMHSEEKDTEAEEVVEKTVDGKIEPPTNLPA